MKEKEEILSKICGMTIDEDAYRIQRKTEYILRAMEEYAQYKVNELNKSDVIKSVCEHEWYRSELMNERRCILCNEKEKIK